MLIERRIFRKEESCGFLWVLSDSRFADDCA